MVAANNICIIAGEASGDIQASHVVASLQRFLRISNLGAVSFWGAAGPALRELGVEAFLRTEELAVMGYAEVVSRYVTISSRYKALLKELERRRPLALVCVDYPGFNMRLIADAYALGITVIYHIPPKVWAHGARRLEKLRDYTHLATCILPFEEDMFRAAGVNAHFVGNPLYDAVKTYLSKNPKRSEQKSVSQIAILPGSRVSEIERVLPPQVQAYVSLVEKFGKEKVRGIISVAPTLPLSFIEETALKAVRQSGKDTAWFRENMQISSDNVYSILRDTDYAWVCSGTAALETAFFNVPMSVMYRMNSLSYSIAKRLVKLRFFSLVNLCAGYELVPEYVQDDVTPERLADHAFQLLTDAKKREEMRDGLSRLGALFPPSAAETAAQHIIETILKFDLPVEDKFRMHQLVIQDLRGVL